MRYISKKPVKEMQMAEARQFKLQNTVVLDYNPKYTVSRTFQVVLVVNNLSANAGDIRDPRIDPWVRKIPWRRGMATHSSIFAWKIPRTQEPGRLQSIGSHRVWATEQLNTHRQYCLEREEKRVLLERKIVMK